MGKIFQPKIPTPPAPPPAPQLRDEINGVEQVPIQNADGSTTYITRAIALTPEQQAERDELNSLIDESLTEIQRLSSSDFQQTPEVQEALSAFESRQQELLGEAVESRTQNEEARLAQRGLGDSSAANSVRRQRSLDEQASLREIDTQKLGISENIRQNQLNAQTGVLGLAQQELQRQTGNQSQAASNGLKTAIAANNAQRASVLDSFSVAQRNARPTLFGRFAQNLLTPAANAVGGFGGAVAGSALGSVFNRR